MPICIDILEEVDPSMCLQPLNSRWSSVWEMDSSLSLSLRGCSDSLAQHNILSSDDQTSRERERESDAPFGQAWRKCPPRRGEEDVVD